MVDYQSRRRRKLRVLLSSFFPSSRRYSSSAFTSFLLGKFATIAVIGVIVGIVGIFLLFAWFSRDLPTPGKLVNADLSQSTRIYDRKGVLLYAVYQDQNRIYTKLTDIPKDLQHATIAIEDKNFYTNSGYSVMGYLRAVRNILFFRGLSGGSTLTQQLVKNVLLSSERTLPRKVKELMLSIQVDKKYTKDQILEMYLNDVPYGGTSIGVEAASGMYFSKPVSKITLAQAAFLAGIPQAPSIYSPYTGNTYYIDRTITVLEQMKEQGYITDKQAKDAASEIKHMKFTRQANSGIKAPWFVLHVKDLLAKQFGEQMVANGGLQVTTTLDYAIEEKAEDIVHSEIDKLKNYHVGNGAAIVADPKTGEVLAMVGGKDYNDDANKGKYNVALLADRQPGSSLKPLLYATAFEKGYTPATMLMDVKTEFPTFEEANPWYTPENYDRKFHGPVQLRFALANSFNIPAVKLLAKVGVKETMQKAYDMGITNWEPTQKNIADVGLSLILGGRETTLMNEVTAYSVFANQGVRHDPVFIKTVKDSNNRVIYQYTPTSGTKVLSSETCFLISHILLDNGARADAFGLSSYLVIPGKTVSVKTGTTDQKKDNWTIGYTPSYVVGVWVGNNDNTPMNQAIASGITGASPIWNMIMKTVLKDKKDEQPVKPDSVVAVQIDPMAGGLPLPGQSNRTEYFIKGTEPTTQASLYQKIRVSKHQGDKLANQQEIDRGDFEVKNYIVLHEDDPVSTDGKNRWQDGINAWIDQNHKGDSLYLPPTQTSDYSYSADSPTQTPTPTPTQGASVSPTDTPTPSPTPTP